MTTSDKPSQGIGLSEAANRLDAFLAGDTGSQTPQTEAATEAPADEDVAEALQAEEAADETPPETEDAEAPEASADDEGEQEAADPLDQLVTVKIDGKTEQIPLREAINGYQRQADYSRKTMAVAEKEKTLQAVAEQVATERAQYAQLLGALQQQLIELQPREPDWQNLYDTDPLEYVRQKDMWRERGEKLQAISAEQQRLAQMQQHQVASHMQALVQQGREKLVETIPAWKDPTRWEADRAKLRQYATEKLNMHPDEVSQIYDPRVVVGLYKAMRYDEIMSKRPAPTQKAGPLPAKPGAPQQIAGRKHTEVTKAKQRLAATGNVRDAAALFEKLL